MVRFRNIKNSPPFPRQLRDIKGLRDTLQDKSRGGFTVSYLENERAEVVSKTIKDVLGEADDGSLVLIYYSGHGLIGQQQKLSLATFDTQRDWERSRVYFNEIADLISAAGISRGMILLDCCYSGMAGELVEPKGTTNSELGTSISEQGFSDISKTITSEAKSGIHESELKPEEFGDGIYLMTACSPTQLAKGDLVTGYGVFTKRIIDGLRSESAIEHPRNTRKQIVTARSLFKYVATNLKNEPAHSQTPMLWVMRQKSDDLIITELALAETEEFVPEDLNWRPLPTDGILRGVTPTYILDDKFKFVDWNCSFEMLVAKQLKLTRGCHAEEFLLHLDNWDEVKSRSMRDFIPPNYPLLHYERLDFKSSKYGSSRFQEMGNSSFSQERLARRMVRQSQYFFCSAGRAT